MRTLFDADGKEVEVHTEEELKDLNSLAESGKSFNEFKESETFKELSGIHETEDISELTNRLKEGTNPNFPKLRGIMKNMSEALKKDGKDIDENGVIIEKNDALTQDDVQKMIQTQNKQFMIDTSFGSAANGLDDAQREVFKKNFDKLTAGEDINMDNINGFISSAKSASSINGPDPIKTMNNGLGNNPGNINNNNDNFADSDKGKDLAGELGMTLEQPAT